MARPLVLVSNDDGYASAGIRALAAAMAEIADVVVVAPETEQSASSHSLTMHRALRLRSVEPGVFAVDGTPADCVYIAIHAGERVLPRRPDLAVSGINHGLNLGQDAFYSGTIAAAREAAMRKIPAIAASTHAKGDFAAVAALVKTIARRLLDGPTPPGTLVNVNVPRAWNREVRATRLGTRIYEELVEFRTDPRGREYLWLCGPGVRHEPSPGTDTQAFDDGAASITPLGLDLSDPKGAAFAAEIAARATA